MIRETAKEYLPLVQALAEGKTIQELHCQQWVDTQGIDTSESPTRYRLKPEPRRWWVVPGETAPLWDYAPIGIAGVIEVVEVLK